MTMNYYALMIIPIIIFVAMGNVLVIVAVAMDRKLRSATNCFLSSLAVADLLVALTVMPPSLAMIINSKYQLFINIFMFNCCFYHCHTAIGRPTCGLNQILSETMFNNNHRFFKLLHMHTLSQFTRYWGLI